MALGLGECATSPRHSNWLVIPWLLLRDPVLSRKPAYSSVLLINSAGSPVPSYSSPQLRITPIAATLFLSVLCLLRCVGAVEGSSFVLLAPSCLVFRLGRALGRWEERSIWISSGIQESRASIISVCRASLVSTFWGSGKLTEMGLNYENRAGLRDHDRAWSELWKSSWDAGNPHQVLEPI